MFNLNRAITLFNQTHLQKIRLNKTWNLVYLQPEALEFLNNNWQLIQNSKFYASHFSPNRHKLVAELVRLKKQSNTKRLSNLHAIVKKLKADSIVSQCLAWEKSLAACLNNETIWEQGLRRTENNPDSQDRLIQIRQQWSIHQAFQYHSSQGLLFLLEVVVEYQYHFTQALKELDERQKTWFSLQPLPDVIANEYRQFLCLQFTELKALKGQALDALLLRLKVANEEKQVISDDVSYFLAQHCQLDLPSSIASLPKYRRIRDPATFNQMQCAIEKYGNENQKKQLYQLAWYRDEKYSGTSNITIITLLGLTH